MPSPVLQDVHVNAALTDISVAYIQDNENYIADKVFPAVPVVHKSDVYYTFSKADFLRDDVQQRADGEESAGGGFNMATQNYSCKVYGFHKDVGDQVRANQDPAVDIDTTTTKFIMQKQLIRRDNIFVSTYMKTGVWGTDITGTSGGTPGSSTPSQWNDDANGDPFTDIATGQTTILQNTGLEPNVLVLGFPVYQALRKHPLVIDRVKYTMQADAKNITPQLLAAAFDVEEVIVSKSVYNTAKEGLTGSYSFTLGKSALLCHRAPAPGLMIPSAGYIFPWQGLTGLNSMGVVVYQDRLPGRGRNTIRTDSDMAFDMQVVSSDLGYYFTTIIS
jgi:Phage major capsid protein E